MIIITQNHNKKVDLLHQMGKIVRQRSLHLHEMYFTEDMWKREEAFLEFNSLVPQFMKVRESFLSQELSTEEKKEFQNVLETISQTQVLQLEIRDLLLGESREQAGRMISEKDLPVERELLTNIDNIINDIRLISIQSVTSAKSEYNHAIVLLVLTTILCIFILIIGTLYVSRRLRNYEGRLFEEKERAEFAINNTTNGIISTDLNGIILSMNPAAASLTQWSVSSAIGLPVKAVYTVQDLNEDVEIDRSELHPQLDGPASHREPYFRLKTRDGREVVVEETVAPVFDLNRKLIEYCYSFRDVSYERSHKDQALRDPLTGIMNRRYLEIELRRMMGESVSKGSMQGLLYLDLDGFKIINDRFGHTAGDKLLSGLANMMPTQVRKEDDVIRMGGDEFVILIKNCDLKTVLSVCTKLLQSIQTYQLDHKGHELRVKGASIGATMICQNSESPGQVLERADQACYAVKKEGGNDIKVIECN